MNPNQFVPPQTTLSGACSLDVQGSFGPDRIVERGYDALHRPVSVTSPRGIAIARTETTTYTANGQVATVTDGNGNRTTFDHDGHGRLWRMRYPVPQMGAGTSSTSDYEQFAYDAAGNLVSRRLRNANSIAYSYDALNRMILKDPPGTDEPDTVSYGYDLLGRMTSAAQPGHTLTFSYDALGRNRTQSGPLGSVGFEHDSAGRRTRMTYPGGGLYIEYDYLVTGEVTRISVNGGAKAKVGAIRRLSRSTAATWFVSASTAAPPYCASVGMIR